MVKIVLRRAFYKNHIAFELPENAAFRDAIRRELERCREKHGDYVLVTLDAPKRARTTGAHSQNRHLNGHIMQICNETGNGYSAVKDEIKRIAAETMGYPFEIINARVHPIGESECGTADCAKLIEAAHILAADLGIILQE